MNEVHSDGLRIDRVLSTQPELGPSIPDGGFGWFVLLGTCFFQLVVPSLSISYGIFMTYEELETIDHTTITVWDFKMTYTPLLFVMLWTIADPICRMLIATSRWPRLVAFCGTCLTCVGVLFLWLGVAHGRTSVYYVISGTLSGVGAALVLAQCDVLVNQYFRLKLFYVNMILKLSTILGFVIVAIVIGHKVSRYGVTHVIIWYHLFLIFGTAICLVFRKPMYLKSGSGRVYNVVQARQPDDDDEEDVYPNSNNTELRMARVPGTPGSNDNNSDNKPNWQRFSDDEDSSDDDGDSGQPKELFTELQVNNNTSYAFDSNDIERRSDDTSIFMPLPSSSQNNYGFLTDPGFYKTLCLQVTIKYSVMFFFTMYPSYLYFHTKTLHEDTLAVILGYVCASAFIAITTTWFNIHRNRRALYIALFSWLGAIGYGLILSIPTEGGHIVGGIFAVISIFALQYVGEPLLHLNVKSEPSKMYVFLNLFTGLSFLFVFLTDISYNKCFNIMGLVMFGNGSLWFCNFVYKRIKSIE